MRRLTFLVLSIALWGLCGCGEEIREGRPVARDELAGTEALLGLELTDAEAAIMQPDLDEQREQYRALRARTPDNGVSPALVFDPRPEGFAPVGTEQPPRWSDPGRVRRPENLEELAFAPVAELSALLRSHQVTSVELTELFLSRLRRHGPELECVITLLDTRALQAARRADAELAAGRWRGPLHGVPCGVKDLLAVEGARTTWGAKPFENQIRPETATVVAKLDEAGAIVCAKLTLGALAWGDVWFGGTTRNPWDLEQGSSGSSAGSASAVGAGLVPFAIGTETWGSIVSPSTRCGVTGLRPTFGRVSRYGAMALSWSMDKIGPIARTVEDCALVFDAIRGADGRDPSVIEAPFPYEPVVDWSKLRIGYLEAEFGYEYEGSARDAAALEVLRALGARLVPISLPARDAMPLSIILSAEAAAAFEELTLSGRDDELVSQGRYSWSNVFRAARFIPAVEYVQANRQRRELMQEMDELFRRVDLYVGPSFEGQNLLVTNLTGHPCVVTPNGFDATGHPGSWCFTGRLFDEATLLAVARAWQEATGWHREHPAAYLPDVDAP
jgi:Asp-tRNA(Asn)/Glu-tRNA(Gln) amidotransferase A subunit family amidase